jgi:hypothetical protein
VVRPHYPRSIRVSRHIYTPIGGGPYDRRSVERIHGRLSNDLVEASISATFGRRPVYYGSSLLEHRLADPKLPDGRYAVVVPRSTWFSPAGRAFDSDDWDACLAALDLHGLTGVVLCRYKTPIPHHPRLLDFQGQTTLPEAVEVLKAAEGYLGIDSWASVLASKLFPARRMSVKGYGGHAYHNRRHYYAPRSDFGWLTKRIEVPPWN